ncbi:Cytochrome P450 3A11 [Halotydeus destructor]|nr:Cytochrome P450 3A11 [Halotydeus destructor]
MSNDFTLKCEAITYDILIFASVRIAKMVFMEVTSTNGSIALIGILLVSAYWWYKRTYSFWSRRGVKGPTPLPFFGNMIPLFFQSYKKVDLENFKKYGNIYGYYDGSLPILAVSDPAVLEKVYVSEFADFANFLEIKSPDPLDYSQILGQEGQNWKRHRSYISSSFTGSRMKSAFNRMQDCEKSMMKYLIALDGQEITTKKVFRLNTLNIVGRTFFSVDFDAYNKQDSQLVSKVRDIFVRFTAWYLFVLGNFPYWAASYLAPSASSDDSSEMLKGFITHTVNGRKYLAEKSEDHLQVLLDAIDDEDKVQRDGRGLTEMEVMANSLGLVGAAYDSTTAAMSNTAWLLAQNPEVQEKIRDEIDAVCDGEEFTYDSLNKMTYLEAVISEALRLEPSDARGFRRTVRDTIVPGTDIRLPANQEIAICYYPVHYDPANFDDPEAFKPERFLDNQGGKVKKLPFYGFGGGPRTCPGLRFSYMNMKLTLATILREFKIEKGSKAPPSVTHAPGAITQNPDNLSVRFVPLTK